MMALFRSEWSRLWYRKTIWLLFLTIPLSAYAAGEYYVAANSHLRSNVAQYAVMGNFPLLGLSEMLMTLINGIVVLLVALLFTEEFQSGRLRLILIRSYSSGQIFMVKVAVLQTLIFLLLFWYGLCSYLIGFILFDNPASYPLFYHVEQVNNWHGFIYNLKAYMLSFITLSALSSILLFFGTISPTTTATIGFGIGYLLFSFLYPYLASYFVPLIGKSTYTYIYFSSLPNIQYEGIVLLLADQPRLTEWIGGTLTLYITIFTCIAYFIFSKKDRWI
ncbi:ABC transporter permease [Mechercharimyces sp. CAU 1602]|uniref:ABC transporter permease n=1 Tax=Mechercharimyces sp. CAU 1602 TaxID=2973933 RepID=UPI002161FD10|nr:ABC transporter permease [Mechercharimyces sp. CAU 1602]MCS1350677.1 ABC transporter permease [Mechercharimyces sp. CAU 1602]